MSNTSVLYARIDSELKENAEKILSQLGVTPSNLIQMVYSQVVLCKGLPFDVRLPSSVPVAIGGMTREELDAELEKGIDSLKTEKKYTAEEVAAKLSREFGI